MGRSLLLLFILILISQRVLFSQEEDSESTLKQADRYVASGNVTKALTTLEDFLVRQPNNIDVQEKKITILLQNERSKDAYRDIEEYIKMYYDQPEYYYLRALLNFQKEKYVKAIDDFDQAIQLNMPSESLYKVYLNRGMAHFFLTDFDLADADFDEVLKINSKSAAAYHGKGMIKYELREYDEAVLQFKKALNLEEENPITHFNLAMTYFRLEEMENACYHFNRSCTLGHRNACRLLMMECAEEINVPN
jgi:tetratricopeptide (TPR) repeat protein